MSIKFYVSLIIRANYLNIQAPIPRRGNVIMLRDLEIPELFTWPPKSYFDKLSTSPGGGLKRHCFEKITLK